MDKIKIVAIGDSITSGYPYKPYQSWIAQAAKRLGFRYVNRGVNGDTTEGMVSRFAHHVLRHSPTHVIIMGGSNDAFQGVDTAAVVANIEKMVLMALEKGIVPFVGIPIPCNESPEEEFLSRYRSGIRKMAEVREVTILDFHSIMVDETGKNIIAGLYDGDVHPNEAGYGVMADFACEKLALAFQA